MEPPPSSEEEEVDGGPRARRMGERIFRAAVDAGVAPDGLRLLARAHRTAMRFRDGGAEGVGGLTSEKHPAYLHPGRTVLILLDDLGETDSEVLAIGAMAESRDLELRVRPSVAARVLVGTKGAYEEWRSLLRPDWRRTRAATWAEDRGIGCPTVSEEALSDEILPDEVPPDEVLVERLVTASPAVQRIGLAEALDHLRHAHLWSSRTERVRAAELARNVFGPVAPRVHPTLARRFEWWIQRVAPGLTA